MYSTGATDVMGVTEGQGDVRTGAGARLILDADPKPSFCFSPLQNFTHALDAYLLHLQIAARVHTPYLLLGG